MASSIRFAGTGPGVQTQDGCSVELYRRYRAGREPQIIASVVPRNRTILELGAGAGRVTHALIAHGYRVTAVDNSPDMLAHIQGAETVVADIETLDLRRCFDAVLLGSHFINVPDAGVRAALLRACWRHVGGDGAVLIERHDPQRLAALRAGPIGPGPIGPGPIGPGPIGEVAGVRHRFDAVRHEGRLVHAILVAEADGATWTQSFTTEILDDGQVEDVLGEAGLRLVRWLDERLTWLQAAALP